MKSTNRAESYAAAVADGEMRGMKTGMGEIIDEGQLSKTELLKINPLLETEEQIERAIDVCIATFESFNDIFSEVSTLTREEARKLVLAEDADNRKRIAAAPDQHIYDFQYHV